MNPFIALSSLPLKELIPGGFVGTIQSEHLTLAYTDLKANVEIPLHHHPEEAVDIVLEGELQMQVGDSISTLTRGMISMVPSNMPHMAKAVTDCKVLTVFYPKRNM